MKVAAIIPCLYEVDGDYLKLCVESLRATVDWDIIVVTNGMPNPPNLRHIEGITQHLHTSDQGQCRAVNIGAKVANPAVDYLFVSNADMYYAPGWDKNLRFDYPVFSPNLIEPTNNAGSAPPFLKLDGGFTLDEFNQPVVDEAVSQHVSSPRPKDHNAEAYQTTGFNLPFFVRKDVWQTIGGYDETYDPWGANSDTDLQTKIELAGIQPMRLRDVLVYHFSNKSGTFDGSHQEAWQRNWDYYTKKWGFNRDDDPKPDTWMAKDLVNKEKNIYHPEWEDRFRG